MNISNQDQKILITFTGVGVSVGSVFIFAALVICAFFTYHHAPLFIYVPMSAILFTVGCLMVALEKRMQIIIDTQLTSI